MSLKDHLTRVQKTRFESSKRKMIEHCRKKEVEWYLPRTLYAMGSYEYEECQKGSRECHVCQDDTCQHEAWECMNCEKICCMYNCCYVARLTVKDYDCHIGEIWVCGPCKKIVSKPRQYSPSGYGSSSIGGYYGGHSYGSGDGGNGYGSYGSGSGRRYGGSGGGGGGSYGSGSGSVANNNTGGNLRGAAKLMGKGLEWLMS